MAPRNVREYISARLGVETETRASAATATLGVAAAQLLPNAPRRIGFTFVNLSLNDAHILCGWTPTAGRNILVEANGGWRAFLAEEFGEAVAWEWLAYADGAASAYLCLETLIALPARGPARS